MNDNRISRNQYFPTISTVETIKIAKYTYTNICVCVCVFNKTRYKHTLGVIERKLAVVTRRKIILGNPLHVSHTLSFGAKTTKTH